MRPSSPHFFPLATPFLVALFIIVAVLIGLIEVGVLEYAYEKIGINQRHVFSLLVLSLLGSYINIPVGDLPAEHVLSNQVINFFGMQYVVPSVQEWPRTIIA